MARFHKKLKAFQLAHELAKLTYLVTSRFPRDEIFGLTSQMRRAAVSVPANIVEGCARKTQKDYLHFLHIAHGSLAEVGYYIELAHELDYFTKQDYLTLNEKHNHCTRTLQALINSIERIANG